MPQRMLGLRLLLLNFYSRQMNHFVLGFKLLLLLLSGFFLYKLINLLMLRCREKQYLSEAVTAFIIDLSRWLILGMTVLIGLWLFGVNVSHILTLLSTFLVLIAVGFIALWSVLTNILCGFLLLLFRPFRFGDVIELRDPEKEKGFAGIAVGLNMFYTTLQDLTNNGVYMKVPNTMFFQRIIICHEGEDTEELKLRVVTRNQAQEEGLE